MQKRFVNVGMVQMKASQDKGANVSKALSMVAEAARAGADVVCLPELFATRYFPAERGENPEAEPVPGPTTRRLAEAARRSKVVLVGGSVCERGRGRNFNTCVVFSERGEALGAYRKVHVPQDEHFYEQDYFSPGAKYVVSKTSCGRIGTLICFDQWYPEAARVNRLMGAQIVFYPTAIGRVRGIDQIEGDWKAAWEAVQVGHAVSNSVVVCAVNRVGVEGATTFWGGSFVCNQFGKVLVRAGSEEGVFVTQVDLELGDAVEEGWGFLRNRQKASYKRIAE